MGDFCWKFPLPQEDGNVGTDGDGGGESLYAARSASSAPLSEEEIARRKQLQEHLSKFSDKREDAK